MGNRFPCLKVVESTSFELGGPYIVEPDGAEAPTPLIVTVFAFSRMTIVHAYVLCVLAGGGHELSNCD